MNLGILDKNNHKDVAIGLELLPSQCQDHMCHLRRLLFLMLLPSGMGQLDCSALHLTVLSVPVRPSAINSKCEQCCRSVGAFDSTGAGLSEKELRKLPVGFSDV